MKPTAFWKIAFQLIGCFYLLTNLPIIMEFVFNWIKTIEGIIDSDASVYFKAYFFFQLFLFILTLYTCFYSPMWLLKALKLDKNDEMQETTSHTSIRQWIIVILIGLGLNTILDNFPEFINQFLHYLSAKVSSNDGYETSLLVRPMLGSLLGVIFILLCHPISGWIMTKAESKEVK